METACKQQGLGSSEDYANSKDYDRMEKAPALLDLRSWDRFIKSRGSVFALKGQLHKVAAPL